MTVLARALQVTYGGYSFNPSDLIRFHDGWISGEFSARFVVRAANPAALATACDTAIQAFRIPHQRLQVTLGGTAEIDWNPSTAANTAFQIIPTISKFGDVWDSGTAQTFEVSIACEKPANKDSRAGRREADVSVQWSESRRRTLTLTGTYTGVAGADVTANYTSEVATWSAAVRSALSGTWEIADEQYVRDDIDKLLHFTQVWQEIIYSQVTAAVVNQHLVISISQDQPGDSPLPDGGRARRLAKVDVQYSASVDRSVQTDLDAVYLLLLPWLAERVQDATGAIGLGLVVNRRDLDRDEHRISVSQQWHALLTTDYIEYLRREVTRYFTGTVLVPVWSATRFARYQFAGPETMTCEVSETALIGGSADRTAFTAALTPLTIAPGGSQWVHTHATQDAREEIRGGDGYELTLVAIERGGTFEAAANVPAGPVIPRG